MLVGDQHLMEPGFAVGDIAIGDPNVADFRVRPGRRAVLLIAKGKGRTKLILLGSARQHAPRVRDRRRDRRAGAGRREAEGAAARLPVREGRTAGRRTGRDRQRQFAGRRGADPADGPGDRRRVVRALRGARGPADASRGARGQLRRRRRRPRLRWRLHVAPPAAPAAATPPATTATPAATTAAVRATPSTPPTAPAPRRPRRRRRRFRRLRAGRVGDDAGVRVDAARGERRVRFGLVRDRDRAEWPHAAHGARPRPARRRGPVVHPGQGAGVEGHEDPVLRDEDERHPRHASSRRR